MDCRRLAGQIGRQPAAAVAGNCKRGKRRAAIGVVNSRRRRRLLKTIGFAGVFGSVGSRRYADGGVPPRASSCGMSSEASARSKTLSAVAIRSSRFCARIANFDDRMITRADGRSMSKRRGARRSMAPFYRRTRALVFAPPLRPHALVRSLARAAAAQKKMIVLS